jgi:hypothetical protein
LFIFNVSIPSLTSRFWKKIVCVAIMQKLLWEAFKTRLIIHLVIWPYCGRILYVVDDLPPDIMIIVLLTFCTVDLFGMKNVLFIVSALIGESCVNPSRSCITNAGCSGGICQCSSGYYQASTSSCILRKYFNIFT